MVLLLLASMTNATPTTQTSLKPLPAELSGWENEGGSPAPRPAPKVLVQSQLSRLERLRGLALAHPYLTLGAAFSVGLLLGTRPRAKTLVRLATKVFLFAMRVG